MTELFDVYAAAHPAAPASPCVTCLGSGWVHPCPNCVPVHGVKLLALRANMLDALHATGRKGIAPTDLGASETCRICAGRQTLPTLGDKGSKASLCTGVAPDPKTPGHCDGEDCRSCAGSGWQPGWPVNKCPDCNTKQRKDAADADIP